MAEWLSSLRLRLRALLRRRQLEQDLQDEVAFHLAMREDQLRTSGAIDAGAGARRRFGSVTKIREDLREAWAFAPRMSSLLQDLKYAARTLRRSRGFAVVVVLTLGLGIGANTAFFSIINAALLRPLGYADADRLVSVHEGFPQRGIDRFPFSALDFDDFRSYQQSFERVAAYRNVPFELSGGGNPERIEGAKVSANLFRTLGVNPIVGRSFSTAEDRPGVNVAILSWGLWQQRYAANPSIVGQTIQLDRQPYTVIGIMPATFVFPRRGPQFNSQPADLWVPIAFTERERAERATMHNNSVIARLKDGVSLQAARAALDVLAGQIAESYPPVLRKAGFSPRLAAQPLREEISGQFEAPLLMLQAATGLVLLVACANVANLILSRVAGRTREFAVRTALGARPRRLVQLLLCEASLLSVAGGVTGITIAYWAVNAVPAVIARTIPGLQDVAIDLRVLAFTGVMCLATAVIFALLPLATLDRGSPGDSLRDDSSRTTLASRKLRIQRGFVVSTVGLAFVLLVGAGLFIRSFASLMSTDIGFRPAQVVTASMTLPRTFYTTATSVRTFHESLYGSLLALPGVRSVALATNLPLTTYDVRAFTPEGANIPEGAQPTTHLTWVHGPYFETFRMTLRHGRFFVNDEHVQNRSVVIINEKLADLFWPGEDPVGKRLKWGIAASQAPWLTVVGVVGNVADGPIGAEPGLHAYEPFRQLPEFFLNGAVNQFGRDVKAAVLAHGEPRALAALIRQEISTLDRELAIQNIELMDQQVSDIVAPQRFSTLLVGAFAAVALFLASVGLYGLLAFTITQRTREIAVRLALGAERRAVMRMVVAQGAQLVAIGLTAGLVVSLGLTRFVTSLLYRTNQYDLVTFITVPAVLAAAAFIACALPAWRAARVEPATALRAE
ncbi:MAG: FtsX-like permease family protein [Luteitalea sp.]|nr:FtsX-like permease family protein [Luteitalea sp.]